MQAMPTLLMREYFLHEYLTSIDTQVDSSREKKGNSAEVAERSKEEGQLIKSTGFELYTNLPHFHVLDWEQL